MTKILYEHYNYFCDFDPKVSFPCKNWKEKNKVLGGLWGSRVGSTSNWKNYAKKEEEYIRKVQESFGEDEKKNLKNISIENVEKFYFSLKPEANLYVIHNYSDYIKLPKIDGCNAVDYEKCLRDGIDAIELCSFGEEYDRYYDEQTIDLFDDEFCSHWCCDSIVVLNPNAYEVINA